MILLLDDFNYVNSEFSKYHLSKINIYVHLITSFLGITSVIGIIKFLTTPTVSYITVQLYNVSLIFWLPSELWFANNIALELMYYTESYYDLHIFYIMMLLLFSMYTQDMFHYLCDEPTYESTYHHDEDNLIAYLNHIYYLYPCLLSSTGLVNEVMNKLFGTTNNVLYNHIEYNEHISKLYDWVITNDNLSKEHTTHWWYNTLPLDQKIAFHKIASSDSVYDTFEEKFPENTWNVEMVEQMNEIYVSSEHCTNHNSDTVFFMKHIDGPFYLLFPFCKVYRCIFALNENERISTLFPMINRKYTLSTGDFVGFDFNREIHNIVSDINIIPKECRITLKLHYVVYPKKLFVLGKMLKWLTTKYDIYARRLFLVTIAPDTTQTKGLSKSITTVTYLTYLFENYIGFYNCIYFLICLWVNFGYIIKSSVYKYYCLKLFYNDEDRSIGIYRRDRNLFGLIVKTYMLYNLTMNLSTLTLLSTMCILLVSLLKNKKRGYVHLCFIGFHLWNYNLSDVLLIQHVMCLVNLNKLIKTYKK